MIRLFLSFCLCLSVCVCIRLLDPQHLDWILTGLTLYRVPLDPLSEYPEPWSWKMSESERERTLFFFQHSEKNRVPDMGEKWCEKKQSPRVIWLCFFSHHFPPCLGLCFFLNHWKNKVLSLSLSDIFQDQGSGYSLRRSSGTLYGVSPVKIPSKCWGWSNLVLTYIRRLNKFCFLLIFF